MTDTWQDVVMFTATEAGLDVKQDSPQASPQHGPRDEPREGLERDAPKKDKPTVSSSQ